MPPPPRPPSIVSTPPLPPPQEEKLKIWKDRVDLLAELNRTNDEYDRLKEQVRHVELCMTDLSQPRSAKYDDLVRRCERVKLKRDDLFHRLAESDSWPAGPPSKLDEKKEAQMKQVAKLAADLNSSIEEMDKLMKELSTRKDGEGSSKANEMGVGPSLKRRRVEEDAPPPPPPPPSPPPPPPPPPSSTPPPPPSTIPQEEIEAMQHTLAQLESQIVTLQDDLSAQYADVKEAVSGILDTRDEEKSAASNEPPQQLAQLEEEVEGLGSQLEELAEETAKLILQTDEDEKQINALTAQNEQMKNEIAIIQNRVEQAEQNRDRDNREISALSAALSAYVERPPSPPASPFEIEHVLPYLEQPLTQLVRSAIQPQIDQFRNDIQTSLHQQDQELYDTLWSRLDLTLRMVRVVAETVKHPPAS